MTPRTPLNLALPLTVLTLLACGETTTPTQPDVAENAALASGSVALPPNTWTEKAPRPSSALFGASAGVVPNAAGQSIVYVIGGTDGEGGSGFGISVYNAATNTWTGGGEDKAYTFRSNGVGTIGSKLYFSGGYDYGTGDRVINWFLWAYDPVAKRVIRKADMPKATADGVTGVIDGKLYVLPGTCSGERWPQPGYCETEDIRQLFRYNPATNTWTTRRSAPHFHRSGAAGVIDGKFYVAGGLKNFGNQPVADLDVYDPATNTWKTLAPMPTGGAAIGTVMDGKLFVISGSRAHVYNPRTNRWISRSAPTWGHDAVVRIRIDGKPYLVAVGGNHGPYQDIPNPTELYTP